MSALQEHTAPGKDRRRNVNRDEGRKKENVVNVARMNVSVGGAETEKTISLMQEVC